MTMTRLELTEMSKISKEIELAPGALFKMCSEILSLTWSWAYPKKPKYDDLLLILDVSDLAHIKVLDSSGKIREVHICDLRSWEAK